MSTIARKQTIQKQINKEKVLQNELKQMTKGSSVYKQQPNSHIFFKEDATKIFSESKRTMDELVQEYDHCEKLSEEPVEEGCNDTDSLNF